MFHPRVLYAAAADAFLIPYVAFYSRHELVAQAPGEETAAIENAEAEVGSRAERRAWLAANSNGCQPSPCP